MSYEDAENTEKSTWAGNSRMEFWYRRSIFPVSSIYRARKQIYRVNIVTQQRLS